MAKTKKDENMLEKAEEIIEDTMHKAEEKFEEVEGKVKKAVKKAEKKIEKVLTEAAEEVVGDTGSIVVEKKAKKKDSKAELPSDDKKAKLAELLAKAKKLEGKVKGDEPVDLKKRVKPEDEEEKKDTLVPMEDYLKSSIHLGTRVITPDMRRYVYRRRADGLAVFNTALLDDKLREGADYLVKFAPEQILLVCKREAGWKAAKRFAEITGIKVFTKKYPAGILTNTNLENFIERDLVFICDPWLDKNALEDANRIGIPVLSVCDTNNFTAGINQIITGNNKSAKSLGMIFYLLTKLYVEKRGLKVDVPVIQEFVDGWDELQPPK